MSDPEISYDFWRDYPAHDPQAIVWYPLTYGPLDTERVWPRESSVPTQGSSFYVHVPFCAVVCPFCPFNKYRSRDEQMSRFVEAAKREISLLASRRGWGASRLRAGFFGGGTPTALHEDQLAELILHCRSELQMPEGMELTVEGSPETLTPAKLRLLRQVGVTRISFGVQSFDDHYLRMLGRGHDAKTARSTVDMVRNAGFDDVAIDLMYRLPGQTLQEWIGELQKALESGVTHISAYSLFVEPGSPLARVQHRGKLLPLPEESIDMEMFRIAIELLGEHGYELYTLYDFAQPGRRCDHHLVNWQAPQAEYVGIGPGAFSFVRNGEAEFVYGNTNPLESYFQALEQHRLPIEFGVELTREEQMARYMVLGTNAQAIPVRPFAERFGCSVSDVYSPVLEQLLEWGLIDVTPESISLTDKGKLYQANVGKSFATERNRFKPHPAGVDLQKGGGLSLIGIEQQPWLAPTARSPQTQGDTT